MTENFRLIDIAETETYTKKVYEHNLYIISVIISKKDPNVFISEKNIIFEKRLAYIPNFEIDIDDLIDNGIDETLNELPIKIKSLVNIKTMNKKGYFFDEMRLFKLFTKNELKPFLIKIINEIEKEHSP